MKNTVIVFARAPRLGTVKRRLARDIGDRQAFRFHVGTLVRLLRSLRADRTFRTVLAITPDRARVRLPWHTTPPSSSRRMPGPTTCKAEIRDVVGPGMRRDDEGGVAGVLIARIPQGSGDIGLRMDRACRRFPNGNVAIIGCDIPAACAADVRAAFKALGGAQAVFGPAEDGGYWLIGMGPRRPARPFANARWSTEHALKDTLVNFAGRKTVRLRTLRDVDTAADLPSSG
jgi:glycosyltransferase A (GT-A) superfamily protein (DUF2064 family)